jgi:kinesin family protein 5
LGFGIRDGEADKSSATHGSVFYHFLCERLAAEHAVYVPAPAGFVASGCLGASVPPPGLAQSWEELFRELYPLCRRIESEVDEATSFSIAVAARFKPSTSSATESEGSAVVLPLHQKVQLVKEQFGVSSRDAVAMIMRERAMVTQRNALKKSGGLAISSASAPNTILGSPFQECVAPLSSSDQNKENVDTKAAVDTGKNVVDKCPVDANAEATEIADGAVEMQTVDARCSILAVREEEASVLAVTRSSGLRDFRFNRVYGEASAQKDVYELSARRLVMEFLNGKSASIVCYGQTGSGKTFTMFAPPATSKAAENESFRGIVPRACIEILEAVRGWRSRGMEARLGLTYVEVYGNEVSDLLREGQVVGQGVEGRYNATRATDRVGHRYVLDGHSECVVESWAEIDELLRAGDEAKRRAATAMNDRSTRAHSVLVFSLIKGEGETKQKSRFYLADLGGCEQIAKSKTDEGTLAPVTMIGGVEQSRISWAEYYRHRQRVQETLNINMGLFALKRVIETLHRRSSLSAEGVPNDRLPYVPYQDSKLTMILQEALGGAARTLIITTATMDPEHTSESLQTLRFGETCAAVQKRGDANNAAAVRVALEQLERDVAQVEADIKKKERWETRREKRQDLDTVGGAFGESKGEMFTREEVIVKSVLVGAEAERERLEWLLQRQRDLQGLSAAGSGSNLKHYQEMKVEETRDGGLGADWRERDRFRAKMKARDFEDEGVLADAIRFVFRKADLARETFGETNESMKTRITRSKIPAGYFRVARKLRQMWEDKTSEGLETRPFGKAMLDRSKDWTKQFKDSPERRNDGLVSLLSECSYTPEEGDHAPLPHEREAENSAQGIASVQANEQDADIFREGW